MMTTPVAPAKRDKRGGKIGNSGGKPARSGRKAWAPIRGMIHDAQTGVLRKETEEEAWEAARALVRHMAAVGTPVEIMGRYLRPEIMDDATMRKHFAWEIENGRMQADLQVAGVAFRMAVSGRHEASTWRWLERRLEGFQPRQDVNVNAPIKIELIPGDY